MNLCLIPGKFKNYCVGPDMTALAISDLNFYGAHWFLEYLFFRKLQKKSAGYI